MYDRLRDLVAMASHNDGKRTLKQSIMLPELLAAIEDWMSATASDGVLIGGLAYSFYGKPRYTQDADILILNESSLPAYVPGFKRARPHAFRHDKTHVEIEIVEPATINMSIGLAQWIIRTSVLDVSLGVMVRIASPSGVVAAKLGRWELQDQADADKLLDNFDIDVSEAPLSAPERNRLIVLIAERNGRGK